MYMCVCIRYAARLPADLWQIVLLTAAISNFMFNLARFTTVFMFSDLATVDVLGRVPFGDPPYRSHKIDPTNR